MLAFRLSTHHAHGMSDDADAQPDHANLRTRVVFKEVYLMQTKSEDHVQEEPAHHNLTPEARDFLVRELGEGWLREHSFIAKQVTLSEVQRLLPWFREMKARGEP